MSDYEEVAAKFPGQLTESFGHFQRFLIVNASIIIPYSDQILPIAFTYPRKSPIFQAASCAHVQAPFLLQVNKKGEGEAWCDVCLCVCLLKKKLYVCDVCE